MENKFYDIHFHAMNMAHPNILAFIKKLNWRLLVLASPLAPVAAILGMEKIKNVQNLLTLMENDAGSFFMLVEYYLKQQKDLVKDDRLIIDGQIYDSIIITPLLMDFGFKNIQTQTYYKLPPQKPIVSQVEDVFNGIAVYCANELHVETKGENTTCWIVPRTTKAIFEIYPFLGLNTKIYNLPDIKKMLNKYFDNYQGRYANFRENLGKFDGDIKNMGSNFFAGIKLYPPIGFDPWPVADGATGEQAKVEYLYDFCCAKQIPVTVHCSDGGFELDKQAHELTCPERWAQVLKKFETLKLNFAHFGKQSKKKLFIFSQNEWREVITRLIRDYPNIYADFAYVGVNDKHYKMLEDVCSANPQICEKLLFGSDFMINLLDMESYNCYLDIFSKTASFKSHNAAQKRAFCNVNPERFLWRKGG
jgi:hypothetical protein